MTEPTGRAPARGMEVMAVRFGADLWALHEHEAALAGRHAANTRRLIAALTCGQTRETGRS
jgi:hypothetical protein